MPDARRHASRSEAVGRRNSVGGVRPRAPAGRVLDSGVQRERPDRQLAGALHAGSVTVRGWNSASSTVQLATSAQSWSSASTQNIANDVLPLLAAVRRASRNAVNAFNNVKSGPPKAPACCPVTTATVGVGEPPRGVAGGRRAAPLLLGGKDPAIAACGRVIPRVRATASSTPAAGGCRRRALRLAKLNA